MNRIKKYFLFNVLLLILLTLSGCVYNYETEETEILQIIDYISYDENCIDMLVKTEDGQIKTLFINSENIYFYDGDDMVVVIHHVKYNSKERFRYNTEYYLYLNETKINDYVKAYKELKED